MPPTIPINHSDQTENQQESSIGLPISHAAVFKARACVEHSNFLKVLAPKSSAHNQVDTQSRIDAKHCQYTPDGRPTAISRNPTTSFLTATT